jgi:hypothetical protein
VLLGSPVLEVLVGVVFLFLLLSVVASAATELVAQLLALRSRTLSDALTSVLFDKSGRDALLDHPLIKSLSQQGTIDAIFRRVARPSYIPSDLFARALLDNLTLTHLADGTLRVEGRNGFVVSEDLRRLVLSLASPLGPAALEAERLATEVARWFDQSMERVSGWYKRKTQLVLLIAGAIIVVWSNANVLRYADALVVNPEARAAVVTAAEGALPSAATSEEPSASPAPQTSQLTTEQAVAELKKLDFSLGWDAAVESADSRHLPSSLQEVPAAVGANVLGWLLAVAAVSMGAPFWFDALKDLVNLRSVGKKPPSTTGAD